MGRFADVVQKDGIVKIQGKKRCMNIANDYWARQHVEPRSGGLGFDSHHAHTEFEAKPLYGLARPGLATYKATSKVKFKTKPPGFVGSPGYLTR